MSGSPPVHFVEVTTRALEGLPDARGDSVRSMLASDHDILVGDVRVSLGYQVQAEMTPEQIERTVYDLFADPVIEHGLVQRCVVGDLPGYSPPLLRQPSKSVSNPESQTTPGKQA